MLALVKSAPANLMIVLDDSASMTYEILVKEEYQGCFPNPADAGGKDGYCYLFDHLGDNAETDTGRYVTAEDRKLWRSQHFKDNILYYNPNVDYQPWTSYGDQIYLPADREYPKPHPTKTDVGALDLDAPSFTVKISIDDATEEDFTVKHAHYFIAPDGGDPFLVVIDGEFADLKYYRVIETEGTGLAQKVVKVEHVDAAALPEGIAATKSYAVERQNFANWFTYHRKREYVAKAAIAQVINKLSGVRVGILGINGNTIVPLKPLEATIAGVKRNESRALLQALYAYDSAGSTPLREGLNAVGNYFMSNARDLTHFDKGTVVGEEPPFFTEAEGGACQQCFALVMTDGYYSYPDTDYIDVGNADGSTLATAFGRSALKDSLSDTLADVAMYYYQNDLSPDAGDDPPGGGLPDYVPTRGFDEARHQHMVTYGVAFGVDGKLDRRNFDINRIFTDNTYTVPWPTFLDAGEPETIDDFWHATLNARGEFFSAGDPQALTVALLSLTEFISEQLTGSAAPVSVNASPLYAEKGDNALVFQSIYRYENGEWTGDVRAYGLDAETGEFDTATPLWSAAERLQVKNWDERSIATYDPVARTGRVFEYDSLTDDQKRYLGWDGVPGSDTELEAENRVAYLKGKPIGAFRSRSQKLGDIVHSAPVYENGVVYVGANDGMLHAFDAGKLSTQPSGGPDFGAELFAYVPAQVFANLALLTSPDYSHTFFVDLTPTVKSGAGLLEGKPPSTARGVQTILIGGLGKGGKGCFALDVTDPFSMITSDAVAQKVLWEFSNADDLDMGFSFSKPVIVPSNDVPNNPWLVIIGNGYGSRNGDAVLYILNPVKTPDSGLLVKKFNLGGGPDNGLSSPTPVDRDFDGKVDYVYAGDLRGNLWKFDLTAQNAAEWDVAFYEGADIKPLFQAKGPKTTDFPEGTPQPITSKPEITFHPSKNGYLVMFGTGKFLGEVDVSDHTVQSIYGLWDYGDDSDDAEYLGALIRGADGSVIGLANLPEMEKASLVEQQITDRTYAFPNGKVTNIRLLTQRTPNWVTENDTSGQEPNPSTTETNDVGWYFDLSTRERVDTDVLLREGKLIVIGFVPDANRCRPGGGSSYFMEIDAFTGGNIAEVQFDANSGGTLGNDDLVNFYDETDTLKTIPPSGLLFRGKLQLPAILRRNKAADKIGDGLKGPEDFARPGCGEEKFLSTSTGDIRTICEKAVSLGIGSWKEVER
jgi:type IV pilus assembly protein PilY1